MYRAAQDGEMSAKTGAIYNRDHSGAGAHGLRTSLYHKENTVSQISWAIQLKTKKWQKIYTKIQCFSKLRATE